MPKKKTTANVHTAKILNNLCQELRFQETRKYKKEEYNRCRYKAICTMVEYNEKFVEYMKYNNCLYYNL